MTHPFTLVTGFWDIKRDNWGTYYARSLEKYFDNFKRICTLKNDMVVFSEQKNINKISDIVFSTKKIGNVIIIPLELDELFGWSYKNDIERIMKLNSFKKDLPDPSVPEVCCPLYDVVIWSKISLLKKVLIDNPHNYQSPFGVVWLDFGIHKHMFPDKYLGTMLFSNKLRSERVSMMFRSLPQPNDGDISTFFKSHRNRLTAPIISGMLPCVSALHEHEKKIIGEAISLNVVDCEQSIHTVAYIRDPNIFDVFPGDWDDVIKNY